MIFNLVFLLGLFATLTLLATPSQAFMVSMSPSLIKTKISLPSSRAATVVPPQYSRQQPLFLSSRVFLTSSSDDAEEQDKIKKSYGAALRNKLRQATGFSLTAFRATARAATGISISAIYASALAATGLWIRYIMSKILSIFPPGVSSMFVEQIYISIYTSCIDGTYSYHVLSFSNAFLVSVLYATLSRLLLRTALYSKRIVWAQPQRTEEKA